MSPSASNTLILIRCVNSDARTREVVTQIKKELPGYSIAAAPDRIEKGRKKGPKPLEAFPVPSLPVTDEFVIENKLQFYQDRTGWLCGDYVLYRALDLEWDYVWLVEPDIYFLNGSLQIISVLEQFDHELITTNFRRAEDGWYWKKPLLSAIPTADVYGMAFGIMRLSRDLVQQSLQFRRVVAASTPHGKLVPNDESIVATTARAEDCRVIDLRVLYPMLFKFWGTNLKFPIEEIKKNEEEPRIAHAGLEKNDFLEYLLRAWGDLTDGNKTERTRLLSALYYASPATVHEFLSRVSEKRLRGEV